MQVGKHVSHVRTLLESASENLGIFVYPSGNVEEPHWISYRQVKDRAERNAIRLQTFEGFCHGSPILLHFNDHEDNIIWFWSVIYAGAIPVMSTPFSNDVRSRELHIRHLKELLKDPLCLTRIKIRMSEFSDHERLRLIDVETVEESLDDAMWRNGMNYGHTHNLGSYDEQPAMLMLTSGSSGNAKAVRISHKNVLASVHGKEISLPVASGTSFFNFIGFDHVAALIEIHLHALQSNVTQVHVHAADLVVSPLRFLDLASKHKISRTLAPNFFLSKLLEAIETIPITAEKDRPDLRNLTQLASGGEANVVETASRLSMRLQKYGAPADCIVPAFGMTETCGGAIFNPIFPQYDTKMGYELASVGKCCSGIEMRVSRATLEPQNQSKYVALVSYNVQKEIVSNSPGELQLRGDILFGGYFNDEEATKQAFTSDGWFKTGDQAMIDQAGHLVILGRLKEQMTINGVKYVPNEVESAISHANLEGIVPSYVACFSRRHESGPTEQVCLIYAMAFVESDTRTRFATRESINKIVMLQTGSRPFILPLPQSSLPKSTLGKLSRAKIRAALLNGDYRHYVIADEEAITQHQLLTFKKASNETERVIAKEFETILRMRPEELGIDMPFMEMGITSIDLIRLRSSVEEALKLPFELPLAVVINNPTTKSLAEAISELRKSGTSKEYEPCINLQPKGSKTPIFLFHPGVGEILVFVALVKYFNDRPIFAFRARGFNPGESTFQSIEEVVVTYLTALKTRQPQGPYALAGYSWGSMLAFEVAKRLEQAGDEVRFLGALNLPPHIKWRMRQFDWVECLVHLAYFSGLIVEEDNAKIATCLRQVASKDAIMERLEKLSDKERMAELQLTRASMMTWADVAFSLQSRAVNYEPSGCATKMDVFFCRPLSILNITKQQWLDNHLRKWEDFVDDVKYHEVDGAHYTMLLPEFVGSFQQKLKQALKSRGV